MEAKRASEVLALAAPGAAGGGSRTEPPPRPQNPSPDLYQIVQRRPASNAPAVPAPLPVGDFEAVMGPGIVFIGAVPFQLMGFVGLEIGQQIPLLCLCNLFFGYSRHLPILSKNRGTAYGPSLMLKSNILFFGSNDCRSITPPAGPSRAAGQFPPALIRLCWRS